jgi:hypothetical protein
MKITAKSDSEDIRVYVDSVLHLRIPRDKNAKLQSWIEGHTKTFIIEIIIKKHANTIVYDNREMWERVLKLLDEHI